MEGDAAAEGPQGAGDIEGGGDPELARITDRLESLARELDAEPEEERAAELVREASELAAEAGREVDRALRAASQARDAPDAGPS